MKTNLLLVLISFICVMASCTKELRENSISENGLSAVATATDGSVSVRNIINDDMSSWNIRMNDIAAEALSNGSKTYPNRSMIIKEKHDANGNIIGYDVMYKDPSDENASNGWVYVGYGSDGTVIYNASLRGASCQSCHNGGGNSGTAM